MAHYSIFMPGQHGPQNEYLKRVGMGQMVTKQPWQWVDVLENGPDGRAGVYGFFLPQHPKSEMPLMTIDLDRQTWTKGPPIPEHNVEAGTFWLGVEPDRPVTPFDLAYENMHTGAEVKLRDGNMWQVPETMKLPTTIGRSPETGNLNRFFEEEFEDFCNQAMDYAYKLIEAQLSAEEVAEQFPNADVNMGFEITLENSWEYACHALTMNYRLAEPIMGAGYLDLMGEQEIVDVIRATIAFPDVIEVLKKNENTCPVMVDVKASTSSG